MNGKGIKLFENGDKYDGNFQNGKFDGIGIYSTEIKDKNGKILSSKIYEGGWKNNKKAGKGNVCCRTWRVFMGVKMAFSADGQESE